MKLEELHRILKSRPFKSTNDKGQSFVFTFTHVHILRDGIHISDYDLEKNNGNFFIKFVNTKNNIFTNDFKNILLVTDNIKEILNYDLNALKISGRIDITLVGDNVN